MKMIPSPSPPVLDASRITSTVFSTLWPLSTMLSCILGSMSTWYVPLLPVNTIPPSLMALHLRHIHSNYSDCLQGLLDVIELLFLDNGLNLLRHSTSPSEVVRSEEHT